MNTLLEFITLTKGIEYLLAIAFLLGFIGFWRWHRHRGRGLAVRVAPTLVLALAFVGLASTCIGTPVAATPPAETWASVEEAHYLANIFGPAKFAAHEMGSEVVSCQTCHHHSPDGKPGPCSACHSDPFDGKSPDKPGLKAAYHRRCLDCHKEAFVGPMTCTKCHTEKAESAEFKKKSPSPATAPDISHPLLDRYANCFGCHRPEGPLPLPGNHAGYKANVVCLGCHKPTTGAGALSLKTVTLPDLPSSPETASTSAAPAAPAAAPAAPAAAPAGPAAITHQVAGRENCLMCHQQGIGGAGKVPADHAGKGNETCQLCHKR